MLLTGYKLVCVDEMMCTVGTVPKTCWSRKKFPMEIDRKLYGGQTIASCAAITQEDGMIHVSYFKRALDRYDFMKFLRELSTKLTGQRVCIFMDQLPVHRTIVVRELL